MIIYLAQQDVIPTGQEDFFFAYAQKRKPFTGPFQNGSVNLGNENISYVSMNHFEAATATKQKKGIAKKETLLPTKSWRCQSFILS
jgi:hypothetical protein